MTVLQAVVIALVALSGTAVALTRDPLRQIIVNSFFGLVLVVLFVVYQAPDVALSALGVGAVAFPLIVLAAIAKVAAREREEKDR